MIWLTRTCNSLLSHHTKDLPPSTTAITMVIKRVNRTQPIHVTEEKAPASGYIVKGIDGAHGCATVRRSHNHFDPDHAFEPDDPWFDHGHNRARRPYHKPLDATPSIPTIIASITVKSTVGDHCDIEVTDVNGNIIDHLPCVLERLQSLKVASQTAGEHRSSLFAPVVC